MKTKKEIEQGCGINIDFPSSRANYCRENHLCSRCDERLLAYEDILEKINNFLGNYEIKYDVPKDDKTKRVLEVLKEKIEG